MAGELAGTVTFLFTDLVDPAGARQGLGEDGAEPNRRVHSRLLLEATAAHGGEDVKSLGDGLVVAFGSGLDAARCAIALQAAVGRHNRGGGERLNVRVGLHGGDRIREEADYFGTDVATARRICDRAEGGQVLSSGLVRALIGAHSGLSFAELGSLTLRGPGEAVSIYDVAWETASALPQVITGHGPFVGRDHEFAALEHMLEETASNGGRIRLISGEPGIGKTRLLGEVAIQAAGQGWQVLIGRAYESEGMLPYLPLTEALGAHLRTIPDARLASELGDRAPRLALILPDLARRLPDLSPGLPLDPGSERHRLFEAVCDYLLDVARSHGGPGLLVGLEDLHWAHESTLLLLEHLARRIHEAPLALLLTYRDTEVQQGHPLARTIGEIMRQASCEHLPLRRLDAAGVSSLLAGLGGSEPPARLVKVVHGETEGNPLFVREVYHYLGDEGRLFDDEGRWREDVRVGVDDIPQGVRLVIGRRLLRVSDVCRRALTFASVIGRVFDFDLLKDVSAMHEAPLLDAMDEAERAYLVTSGPSRGAAHLMFTHELVRQTLVGDLSLPRRRALHLAVAESLERLQGHNLEPHLGELAFHYSFGGEPKSAERAVDYASRAARQARAAFAHHEAAGFYEAALESLGLFAPRDDPRRCDLLIEFGEALLSSGDPGRAVQVADEAFAIAEANGRGACASHACRLARVAMLHVGTGSAPDSPQVQMWAARADRVAAPETLERAWACVMLADTLTVTKRSPEAWALYQQAFEMARRFGSPELQYDICTMLLGWSVAPARDEAMSRMVREALEQPKAVAISSETLGRFGMYEGLFHLDRGDADRGWQAWEALGGLAHRIGSAYLLLFAKRTTLITRVIRGELEPAVDVADGMIAQADEIGSHIVGRLWTSNVVSRALLHLGRPTEALRRLDEAQRASGLSTPHNALLAARLATLAALVEDPACHDEIGGLLAEYQPDADRENSATWILLSALEAAIAVRDRESVVRLSRTVLPCAHHALGFLFLATPARILGDAAAFLGQPAVARDWYRRAIEAATTISLRPDVALARLSLAELVAVHFRTDLEESRENLALAIPALESMNMAPALERARCLDHRLGPGGPVRTVYPDRLSEREVEVLRLLIGGASSREIGEALVLSVRTVERHVANIYLKTGTHGRAQVTAYALARGLGPLDH